MYHMSCVTCHLSPTATVVALPLPIHPLCTVGWFTTMNLSMCADKMYWMVGDQFHCQHAFFSHTLKKWIRSSKPPLITTL